MDKTPLKGYDCIMPRVLQYSYVKGLMCTKCQDVRTKKKVYDPPMTVAVMKESTKFWDQVANENENRELRDQVKFLENDNKTLDWYIEVMENGDTRDILRMHDELKEEHKKLILKTDSEIAHLK